MDENVRALIALRDHLREVRDRQHEVYENCRIQIGDFTYGTPTCFSWGEDAKCTIGKFCSIGANVQIYLGGNHHNDWLTTYPFNAMPTLKGIWGDIDGGVAASKGDVIIGNRQRRSGDEGRAGLLHGGRSAGEDAEMENRGERSGEAEVVGLGDGEAGGGCADPDGQGRSEADTVQRGIRQEERAE